MTKELDVESTRVFDAPRDVVWALAADTNRWDRASGLSAAAYTWREIEGRRARVGRARELGYTWEWVEPPYEWIEACFLSGERRSSEGPIERAGVQVRLEDTDGGRTRVHARAFLKPRTFVVNLASMPIRSRFKRGIGDYFDSMEKVLASMRASDRDARGEPAVMRVRRALMNGYDPLTSGPRSEAVARELTMRARRLRDRGISAALADHIEALLRDRPDEEVAQIRPFELAKVWQLPRADVLRAFLHATRAGLVDLRWQINCPVCRVSAGVAPSLDGVGAKVHCGACNIDYGVDFGAFVEAVFQANPAIRVVTPQVFCASSPSFLPHVFGQIGFPAHNTREERCVFPGGMLRLRTLGTRHMIELEVDERAILDVKVGKDGIEASARPAEKGEGLIRIASDLDDDDHLLVERAGWSADAVLGSVVASFPDFLDLFATEAPAAGVDLAIGHLCLLFSDLTGSTALYERVGDARAFAIVQEHFDSMEGVIRGAGGAIVKTMGDAVMASFSSPFEAVRAAVAMIEDNEAQHGALGLGVKLGVYAGPCLAVRANDRLDFFGTTVNLAARLQNEAKGGEIVISRELAAQPEIAELLAKYGKREFEARLKGIALPVPLVGVKVRELLSGEHSIPPSTT